MTNVTRNAPAHASNATRDFTLDEISSGELFELVIAEVVKPTVEESYSVVRFALPARQRSKLRADAEKYPDATIEFRVWLNPRFLTNTHVRHAATGGRAHGPVGFAVDHRDHHRVCLSRSAWARRSTWKSMPTAAWINRIIQTNIDNLAGVPSIVYGILGLAIFVRTLSRPDQRQGLWAWTAAKRAHRSFRPG